MPTDSPQRVAADLATYSSGVGPLSGVITFPASSVVELSGPWFVQEQSLDFQYVRLPKSFLSSTSIGLSGAPTATYAPVNATMLACTVQASYTAWKDETNYATSGFQLPQRFEIQALSTDPNGNTYGALDSSSLGPMGQIITSQKFYKRVPWVESIHAGQIASGIAEGLTFYASSVPFEGTDGRGFDGRDFINNYEHSLINSVNNGSIPAIYEPTIANEYIGYIQGEYAVAKENKRPSSVIDKIAVMVTYSRLYPYLTPESTFGSVGVPQYRSSRHDYSV